MKPMVLFAALVFALNQAFAHSPPAVKPVGKSVKVQDPEIARNYFTDRRLVTQDNKEVRFYSDVLRDKIVVINFLYTRCRDVCPMATKKLQQAQKLLGESSSSQIRLVSITADPEWDTHERLKAYAELHEIDENWLLLTGEKHDIGHVIRKLGQLTPSVESHSSLFLLGNVNTGHWMKMVGHSSPQQIAEQLQTLLTEL